MKIPDRVLQAMKKQNITDGNYVVFTDEIDTDYMAAYCLIDSGELFHEVTTRNDKIDQECPWEPDFEYDDFYFINERWK